MFLCHFQASHVICHRVHVLPNFPCQFLNVMLYHAVSRVCYIKLSFPRRSRCLIMFFLSASPVPITQPWHAPACPSARVCVTCLPQPADPVAFHGQVVSQFSCGSFRPSGERAEPSARRSTSLPGGGGWGRRAPPRPELNLSNTKVEAAGPGRSSSPRRVSHACNYPGAMIVISQVNTTALLVPGWPSWPRRLAASVISDSAAADTVLLR